MAREGRLRRTVERSRYAPLYRHLRARTGREWQVSFAELEEVLGFRLPESALVHRSWWSNQRNGGGHGHSLAWQAAGWKTRAVDLEEKTLVFERSVLAVSASAPARDGKVALDEIFPPHDAGRWPAGLSLRREDLYDDRGR